MKGSDGAWRGVTENDGEWRRVTGVTGGDGVTECPDTLEQGGTNGNEGRNLGRKCRVKYGTWQYLPFKAEPLRPMEENLIVGRKGHGDWMDGGMERTDGKITRGSEINQSVIDGVYGMAWWILRLCINKMHGLGQRSDFSYQIRKVCKKTVKPEILQMHQSKTDQESRTEKVLAQYPEQSTDWRWVG